MSGTIFAAVLASAVLHASWNFLAKGAAGDFKVLWLSVALWAAASLPPAVYILLRDGLDPRSVPPLFVSIAAHACYFVTLNAAYRTGEISTAYPVARGIGVAGTGAVGYFILREGLTSFGAAGILLVVTGVLFIGKSGLAAGEGKKGYLFAILTGAAIVAYSVSDKFGAARANPFLYLGLLNMGSALLTAPLALGGGAAGLLACAGAHRLRIPLISFGSGLTYLLILWVYRMERAGYIVAVRESSVVVAVFLGRFFLRERIGGWKAAGVAAVVAGLVLIRLG